MLAHKSFRLGEFQLSSGSTSDYYIDCRVTTLDARGAQLVGEVFLAEIREQGWEADAIGGLTMGADPIVVAVAVTSGTMTASSCVKRKSSTVPASASKASAKKARKW